MSLKIDLHTHTIRSDGRNTYAEMIAVAKKRGLNGIAFTDHDVLPKNLPKPFDFIVIPGVEITTNRGHVIVLGKLDQLPPRDLDSLLDYVKDNPLVAFAPHPFDFPTRNPLGKIAFEKFKLVEGVNGGTPEFFNLKAIAEAEKRGIKWLCNSDAHSVKHLGRFYNLFEEDVETVDDVLDALLKGRFEPVPRKVSFLDLLYRKVTKTFG